MTVDKYRKHWKDFNIVFSCLIKIIYSNSELIFQWLNSSSSFHLKTKQNKWNWAKILTINALSNGSHCRSSKNELRANIIWSHVSVGICLSILTIVLSKTVDCFCWGGHEGNLFQTVAMIRNVWVTEGTPASPTVFHQYGKLTLIFCPPSCR